MQGLVSERTLKDQVSACFGKLDFKQVRYFKTDEITFSEDLIALCERNACGRYNKSWNCPPNVGELSDLIALCKTYENAVLFNETSDLEDPFDWDGMMNSGNRFCDKLTIVNSECKKIFANKPDNPARQAIKDSVQGKASALSWLNIERPFRIFGSGSCESCDPCTCPNQPCKDQENFFIPLEAAGVYVGKLSKLLDMSYVGSQNTVTYFGMLLYND